MASHDWIENEGAVYFVGIEPEIDTEGSLDESDIVRLELDNYTVDVIVDGFDDQDDEWCGSVIRIWDDEWTPLESIDGMDRGDQVWFHLEHVFQVWRH